MCLHILLCKHNTSNIARVDAFICFLLLLLFIRFLDDFQGEVPFEKYFISGQQNN